MFYTAFVLGFLSSLHCIGMCGPIALMLPLDQNNRAKKINQIILYNLGRLVSYGVIGFFFGLLGRGFYMAGLQQKLSIFIGIVMILVYLISEKKISKYGFYTPVLRFISKVKSAMGKQFSKKSYPSIFFIGFLNGFLPCAMVYVALFGAIAMQNELLGAFYMMIFGLGTIPLMSSIVYIHSFLTLSVRNKIQKIIPFFVVILGILFILRGLGLGIPYVSPSDMNLFVQSTPNCK